MAYSKLIAIIPIDIRAPMIVLYSNLSALKIDGVN